MQSTLFLIFVLACSLWLFALAHSLWVKSARFHQPPPSA